MKISSHESSNWRGPVLFLPIWGVDALLGTQTREHEDLDIAVERQDMPKLLKLLEARDFKHIPRKDDQEYMFVVKDPGGRRIDFHAYEFDKNGKNIYGIE